MEGLLAMLSPYFGGVYRNLPHRISSLTIQSCHIPFHFNPLDDRVRLVLIGLIPEGNAGQYKEVL